MRTKIWIVVFIGLWAGQAIAQETCPAFLTEAIANLGSACANTGRNEACYGNNAIAITPDPTVRIEPFDTVGDLLTLTAIDAMTLSPFDEATAEWGLSVLKVQATIPDSLPGQNVTMLLAGDTTIENAGNAMEAFTFVNGIAAPGCTSAPNGIVIQTPQGAGKIAVTANNVTFSIGSTIILENPSPEALSTALDAANTPLNAQIADGSTLMSVTLVEGSTSVLLGDVVQALMPLQTTVLAIGTEGVATVIAEYPTSPEVLMSTYGALLETLPEPIMPDPLTGDMTTISTPTSTTTTITTDTCQMPLSGVWTSSVIATDVSGCPGMGAMIAGSMETSFGNSSGRIEIPVPFDPQQFVENYSQMAGSNMSMSLASSNACQVVMTTSQQGAEVQVTFNFQTQDTMAFDLITNVQVPDFACALTVSIQLTRTGE